MHTSIRRYIFVDYENLKHISFNKLEQVCDKIFIFAPTELEQIPFVLARQLLKLGQGVKWIMMEKEELNSVQLHLSFLIGKLHHKVSTDIEFAILSNDESYDSLVHAINNEGRSCLRVKRKTSPDDALRHDVPSSKSGLKSDDLLKKEFDESSLNTTVEPQTLQKKNKNETRNPSSILNDLVGNHQGNNNGVVENLTEKFEEEVKTNGHVDEFENDDFDYDDEMQTIDEVDRIIIEETSRDTIRRLIRSGNRPAEKENLKNYILIHNQDKSVHHNIDKVIDHLVEMKEIRINDKEIIYNF